MESYDFVHSIKAEKADALARYRTYTKVTKLFQIIEVFVAFAVISWSSTRLPLVIKFSGEYVTSLSSFFMNQHVVFIIGNLIVVVCYVLSRYSDYGNESAEFEFHSNDGKFSRLTHREKKSDDLNAKSVTTQAIRSPESSEIQTFEKSVIKTVKTVTGETEIVPETKQMEQFQRTRLENKFTGVYFDDGNYRRLIPRKTTSNDPNAKMMAIRSPEPSGMQNPMILNNKSVTKLVKTVTGEPEMRQIERFQRTRSEKVKREIPVKSRRELRRSVTEMRRSVAVASGGGESVEKLSNEEFRIRVEAFIMKQQRFLKQQSKV